MWLGERAVDIIVRTFLIRDVITPRTPPRLTAPVFDAARRGGEVKIFTPLDTSAYASKAALSLLSEEATGTSSRPRPSRASTASCRGRGGSAARR